MKIQVQAKRTNKKRIALFNEIGKTRIKIEQQNKKPVYVLSTQWEDFILENEDPVFQAIFLLAFMKLYNEDLYYANLRYQDMLTKAFKRNRHIIIGLVKKLPKKVQDLL